MAGYGLRHRACRVACFLAFLGLAGWAETSGSLAAGAAGPASTGGIIAIAAGAGLILGVALSRLWLRRKYKQACKRATIALREKEQRYRAIFNSTFQFTGLMSPIGTLLEANQAALSFAGVTIEEVVDRPFWETRWWAGKETRVQQLREAISRAAEGQFIRYEVELQGEAENTAIFDFTIKPILDDNGKAIMLVPEGRDITARKRAEAALNEKNTEINRYFSTALDLFCIADTAGFFRQLNAQWETTLGYAIRELEGRRFLDFVHPDDLESTLQAISQLEAKKPVLNFVNRYRCKGGSYRWLEWRSIPQDDMIYAAAHDITERKQSEEALLRQQIFTNTLLDSLPGVFYLYAYPELTLVRWNTNHETLFGYGPGELNNRSMFDWHPPEKKELLRQAVEVVIKEGQNVLETPVLCKDGSSIPLLMTGTKFEAEGKLYIMGVGIDVTDRKRIEEERQKLEEQLRQAQRMEAVGQLAGGIAHDFNNLLQVILGNVEILLAELSPGSTETDTLAEVHSAAERAASLTQQLLAFSRRQMIQPATLDLNELIQGVFKMIQRVIGENIEFRSLPGANIGAIHVDRGQMEQVLMNLCVNARDAMPNGGKLTLQTENIILTEAFCRRNPWAVPGAYVLLTVSDTGHGMDKTTQKQIFEPFFTTKGIGEGTGLGLATAYGVVKQHHGLIHVESEPDKGTAFMIYLPKAESEVTSPPPVKETPVTGGHETILIAEDEETVRALIRRILESAGYTVLTACDGEDALRVYEENAERIDLVILDVMMPKMGGREVMDRLQPQHPQLRFLFSSGYSEDAIHSNFAIKEGLRLISKPYRKANLLRAIREILDASPALHA